MFSWVFNCFLPPSRQSLYNYMKEALCNALLGFYFGFEIVDS